MARKEITREEFEDRCYRAYQLEWMISHGLSLMDAYKLLIDMINDQVVEGDAITADGDIWIHAERAKETFISDTGFVSGLIFACKDEFLDAEFLDGDYMDHLFYSMPETARMKDLYQTFMRVE